MSRERSPALACSAELLQRRLSAPQVAPRTAERLEIWTRLLERWSGAQRLVGWRDAEGLLEEGLRRSWAALPLLARCTEGGVLDMGSGAGLPGLIWAAARPELQFILVERRRKRASFLREAARRMELEHVDVRHGELHVVGPAPGEGAGLVITGRAFSDPKNVIGEAERLGARAALISSSRARLPGLWPAGWGVDEERADALPGGSEDPHRVHILLHRVG